MAETSPLRRRMIEDMTIRNLSPATQQSYLYAVSKFSLYFGRSPDRLGVEDIRAYLVHLAAKGFAWSSVNQVGCALRFFYGVTLGQATLVEKIPHARVNFHRNGTPVLRRKGTPWSSMIGADVAGREAGLGSNDHGCPRPDPRAGVKAREATRFSGLGLDAEHGSGTRPRQFR